MKLSRLLNYRSQKIARKSFAPNRDDGLVNLAKGSWTRFADRARVRRGRRRHADKNVGRVQECVGNY